MTVVPVKIASQAQESHAAPHLDHLDLRNAMAQLMTLLASHDATVSANGVT